MRCVVVGAGFVGLTSGIVLAEGGHEVTVVDVDESKLARIASGRAPFFEPGVDEALASVLRAKKLRTSARIEEAMRGAELVLVCVGTPPKRSGEADLTFVEKACRGVGSAIISSSRPPIVVVKSTVPPGTSDSVVRPALESASGLRAGAGFHVASNPEFLREGRALEDARGPDRIVVGAHDAGVAETVAGIWKSQAPRIVTDPTTAELVKYAANTFLATKISFANEMALLCDRLGVDVYQVMGAIGLDRRIGSEFLRAGAGFGGSCFPKDVQALARFAQGRGLRLRIPGAVLEINEAQPRAVVDLLSAEMGTLRGRRIALLGAAFKADTDDVRETRAAPIFDELRRRGAKVVVWDPLALEGFQRLLGRPVEGTADLREALKGADAALIQTEWRALRELPASEWRRLMRGEVVVDGRRGVDASSFAAAGLRYRAIGAGSARADPAGKKGAGRPRASKKRPSKR